MRPLKLWHRVGPPTWKRSGTLVFIAVISVLLVGGTAMAANLGLLTGTASTDRGDRLSVPRPALSVSLPTTDPAPPQDATTSVADIADGAGGADDAGTTDSTTTEPSDDDEGPVNDDDDGPDDVDGESGAGNEDVVDETVDGRQADRRPDNPDRRGGQSEGGDGHLDGNRWSGLGDGDGDGRLDDD